MPSLVDNLIIQREHLHALKPLLPVYSDVESCLPLSNHTRESTGAFATPGALARSGSSGSQSKDYFSGGFASSLASPAGSSFLSASKSRRSLRNASTVHFVMMKVHFSCVL